MSQSAIEKAKYRALKRSAAIVPESTEEKEQQIKDLLSLLNRPDWKNKTIYLKYKTLPDGKRECYLSKWRDWRDFLTNKGHKQSRDAGDFLRVIAENLGTGEFFGPAGEALVKALTKPEHVELDDKGHANTACPYGGETENYRVLRDAFALALGAFANARMAAEAKKKVDSKKAEKQNAPAEPQPATEKPIATKFDNVKPGTFVPKHQRYQGAAPAKAPEPKMSPWGHYPAAVPCGPARGDKPRFTDPKVRDKAAFDLNQYLNGNPPAPAGLLYGTVNDKGEYEIGVRPANAAIDGDRANAEHDVFTQFLYELCDGYAKDPNADPTKQRYAARLLPVLKGAVNTGRAFENSPAMKKFIAQLAKTQAKKETPTTGPVVAVVDSANPERFHLGPYTPANVLKSLPKGPDAAHLVLRTVVRHGALYVEAVPPRVDTLKNTPEPADRLTCNLLLDLARAYANDPDRDVRAMAQQIKDAAIASRQDNRAIVNHPGLHQALAVLAKPRRTRAAEDGQERRPRRNDAEVGKPVLKADPAAKRASEPTPWVRAGSYPSQGPRKLRPQPAALTQLVNSLRNAPETWLLEVGFDVTGSKASVRARPPVFAGETVTKETVEATSQYFSDLAQYYIETYGHSKKESDKAIVAGAHALLQIAAGAVRQQINTPVANSQRLQMILEQLAAAG